MVWEQIVVLETVFKNVKLVVWHLCDAAVCIAVFLSCHESGFATTRNCIVCFQTVLKLIGQAVNGGHLRLALFNAFDTVARLTR